MIKKIKRKLAVKVFIITALLMAACCTVTYLFIAWSAPRVYSYDLSEVDTIAYELSDNLSMERKENVPMWFESANEVLQESYDGEFVIHFFQSDGEEVSLQDVSILTGKGIDDYNQATTTKQYTTSFLDDTSRYTVLLSRNTDKASQVLEALGKTFPALSIVIITVSIIAAFFYSWYITAPIKKMSRLSKQMADMDFSGRCAYTRSDEIGVLASSLNELSGKLVTALTDLQKANEKLQSDIDRERQLERQRLAFFSAVSHELKTPITIVKGQLQGMLCQVGRYKDKETYLAQSIGVMETLEKMVQELLTISRIETPGYSCNKATFDFSKLLGDRLTAHEDLFVQRDLTLEKSLPQHISIYGDCQLLQKVIDNLIGNALMYSPAGNTVSARLWKKTKNVYFSIENTGAHIPDEALPKVFEAFYRVEQSRNRQTGGSGLGLYIIKTILNLHDADIQITNSPKGVIVTIQL